VIAFLPLVANLLAAMEQIHKLTFRRISVFWMPLAATWLMMAVEWPFTNAVVARLAEPKINLAAWGVAYAIAIFFEAPMIMIMSASTALARDRRSFEKLKWFTYTLCGLLTLLQALLVFTPAFDFIALDLMNLPPEVARITRVSLMILLPWPAAIGFRRFYQGLLIRNDQTKLVSLGTVVRMTAMIIVALGVYYNVDMEGAYTGALAVTVGVTTEAIVSRIMARGAVKKVLATDSPLEVHKEQITYRSISKFYSPLALMSVLSLAVHPMVVFFVGHSRFPVESLAVIPVVNALTFLFRALGLSYQEVVIALMGDKNEHYKRLRNFAVVLGLAVTLGLGLIALTPLCGIWFERVAGLSASLASFTVVPIRILMVVPAFSVLVSMQRAILVNGNRTTPLTVATVIEVVTIIAVLFVAIDYGEMVGATAAAVALLVGRILGTAYLVPPCLGVLRKRYGRQD
jgi:O-antigen/teichoic acid export membrane protein